MSVAITSDIHLGDPNSRLSDGKDFYPYGFYKDFRAKIFNFTGSQPLDYLVLCGDILDFSINSFENSIHIGRHFFQQLYNDKIAKQIVYVPGNHDKQIWDGVEWDSRIIKRLNEYRDPDEFRHIQNGIINLAKGGQIELDGVVKEPGQTYGNIYLKGLFLNAESSLPINIVYPNLYLLTENDSILITHGHMFEAAWVILSEMLYGLPEYLPVKFNLPDLEAWNIPVTASICTGVGQAKEVSDLIQRIEEEAYKSKTDALAAVLDHVFPKILDSSEVGWLGRIAAKAVMPGLKNAILKTAAKTEDTRFNQDKLQTPETKQRLLTFYNLTLEIMKSLNLPRPSKFIYGHTHLPTPASNPFKLDITGDLEFYNTGGWLPRNDNPKNVELFLIDNKRFTSVSI